MSLVARGMGIRDSRVTHDLVAFPILSIELELGDIVSSAVRKRRDPTIDRIGNSLIFKKRSHAKGLGTKERTISGCYHDRK